MTHGIDTQVFDMTGRRTLITGAAGGIGSAMARSFHEHNASIVLADKDRQGLEKLAKSLGGETACLIYEQSDPSAIQRLADQAGPIDILLNNAGFMEIAPLQMQTAQSISTMIAVNLTGPILLANAVAKGMIARGNGVIINTVSQLAFCGAENRSIYATTKAGLVQFTRTAASEWAAHGVRVVALGPGPTETPMIKEILDDPEKRAERLARIPWRRFGSATEMARLSLLLASDLADNVIGHTLVADGGYLTVG